MTPFDKRLLLPFIPVALVAATGAFNADDKMIKKAGEAVRQAIYRGHVQELSSDEMQGREPGSEGERRTIEYLEKEFLELGLQPAAGGDFRQDVALVEITGSDQKLSFSKGAGGMTLVQGDDMVLGSRRTQESASIAGSEVVFVGYGIQAREYDWNDYTGIDMRGKTALILVNDPGFVTGEEDLFRGKAQTFAEESHEGNVLEAVAILVGEAVEGLDVHAGLALGVAQGLDEGVEVGLAGEAAHGGDRGVGDVHAGLGDQIDKFFIAQQIR